jgi:uncharacterized protein (TIGR03435 family)
MKTFLLPLIAWGAALAQPPAPQPEFEVASIKPAAPSAMNQIRSSMNADGATLRYTNVSLKDVIRAAYRVKEYQVEGPDWIDSTRFDIVARLPRGSSESQIPEMLQALLAKRFGLSLHRETKPHAIYQLVVAKGGPRLKPAENAMPGSGVPRGAMTMLMDAAGMHLKAASATLATLGEWISRFCDRPIVDMTGIQGQYDFDLVFTPETVRGMPAGMRPPMGPEPAGGGVGFMPGDSPDGPGSIIESVDRYGLKLEPRKAPMEILVLDQIAKTPTEN